MTKSVFSLSLFDVQGNPRTFIAGQENSPLELLPEWVATAHCEQPLVLWGATGIGKTWLCAGLLGYYKKYHPQAKTLYLTGIDFARQYADAVDTSTIDTFRHTLRHAHCIVVDGVQQLHEKPAAGQELCALIDYRLQHGTPSIAACSVSPTELAMVALRSRLCGGLSLQIHAPEHETQLALLSHFAQELEFAISMALLKYLQERLASLDNTPLTPRKLQASLKQLFARYQLLTSEPTPAMIDSVFPPVTQGTFELKKLLTLVAKRSKVTITELRSSSRKHSLVRARGVLALLARYLNNCSYSVIGQELGNRDHSTIHHAVEKVTAELEEDLAFRTFVEQLKNEALQRFNMVKPTPPWLGKLVAPLSENVGHLHDSDTSTPLLF